MEIPVYFFGAKLGLSQSYRDELVEIARETDQREDARNGLNVKESGNLLEGIHNERLNRLSQGWVNAISNYYRQFGEEFAGLYFHECWCSIADDTTGFYTPHSHSSGYWSGVYYPKAPKGSGAFNIMHFGGDWHGGGEGEGMYPEDDLAFFFHPKLIHYTRPNTLPVERVTFAFNSLKNFY